VEPAEAADGPVLILPDRAPGAGRPAAAESMPLTAVRDLVLQRMGLESE
jgi:hypothetical protein